jgi:hypothetical protein
MLTYSFIVILLVQFGSPPPHPYVQIMNLTSINFLSDNEQLVKFLNSSDHFHSPDWRIEHFTQMFSN